MALFRFSLKFRLIFIFFLFSSLLWSQTTIEILSLPSNTPASDTLFITGDFNDWQPDTTPLSKNKSGQHTFRLPEEITDFSYKITRGSWDTAEGNEKGEFRENRKLHLQGRTMRVIISIESWEDQSHSTSTAADNVHVLDSAFYIPQLDRTREIWIYLPPDYKQENKHYPVIYMHDGQNLFDETTAFSGEWEVDESLNLLFKEGDYGAIVVGIANDGDLRLDEYSPWKNPKYGGGDGQAYMEFIKEELKPYIDSHYRTCPKAEHTALIGSSMGGLISTYGGVEYASTFGKIGSLSPAYWFAQKNLESYIQNATADLQDSRFFFIAGKEESKNMTEEMTRIKNQLKEKELKQFEFILDPKGEHNEGYWKKIFPQVYTYLFGE